MKCDARVAYVRALNGDEVDQDKTIIPEVSMGQSKRCIKCGQVKPLAEFEPNKLCKDGHVNTCKVCRAEAARMNRAKKKAQLTFEKAAAPAACVKTNMSTAEKGKADRVGPEKPMKARKEVPMADLFSCSDTQALIAAECDAIKTMLLNKNREYGDSAVNPLRIFSKASNIEQIKVRIDDKISRLQNQGEKTIAEDTVLDLIGYFVLLRVAEKAANTVGIR